MRIAVCDDNREYLNELSGYIEEYFAGAAVRDIQEEPEAGAEKETGAEKRNRGEEEPCTLRRFSRAKELLLELERKPFDVYFLDVLLPDLNGMGIGRIIRERDHDAFIVYVTVSREFAFEAFGVRAFHYLQKSADRDDLFRTLDQIREQREKRRAGRICARTQEGLVNIPIADIMYVENVSRRAVYVLKNGERVISLCNRSSFEKNVNFLNKSSGFVQPHKSYFVNMNFIRTFDRKTLSLDDGTQIAVSRNRFAETKKTYLDFVANGGEAI